MNRQLNRHGPGDRDNAGLQPCADGKLLGDSELRQHKSHYHQRKQQDPVHPEKCFPAQQNCIEQPCDHNHRRNLQQLTDHF